MVPNPTDRFLGDERVDKHHAKLPFHVLKGNFIFLRRNAK